MKLYDDVEYHDHATVVLIVLTEGAIIQCARDAAEGRGIFSSLAEESTLENMLYRRELLQLRRTRKKRNEQVCQGYKKKTY